jgi:hypothetical protein
MPVQNATTTRGGDSNAATPANAFEVKVTDPIEGGKEVVGMHGQNASSPANTFEGRITQETGSH